MDSNSIAVINSNFTVEMLLKIFFVIVTLYFCNFICMQ